jgi:CheY-like chemotaxis protein
MMGTTRRDLTVLVVDDDEATREAICEALEADGWDTVTAGNGLGALTVLATIRVDVMLLDLMMPAMSGWELLEVVSGDRTLRHIPIVVASASPAALEGLPVAAFLRKPFLARDLLGAVQQAVSGPAVGEPAHEVVDEQLRPRR